MTFMYLKTYIKGTYNEYEMKSSPIDCVDCKPGYFCSGSGNEKVTGLKLF